MFWEYGNQYYSKKPLKTAQLDNLIIIKLIYLRYDKAAEKSFLLYI